MAARWIAVGLLAAGYAGCAHPIWRDTAPWNFPPAEEWNKPLEFSWQNAVDKYRELTAPEGMEWDFLTRSYRPILTEWHD